MKRPLFWGLVGAFVLLAYGAMRFPSALHSPSGFLGDCLILILYGLVFQFWFTALEKDNPQLMRTGLRFGLLIGAIFASEMLLEYILLPKDNTKMGRVEYGSVLAIFFLVGLGIAYQTGRFRNGLCTAIVSAMVGSVIFLIAVLTIYYFFHGTFRQTQIFQAEGNFEDFARSGMTDLDAFIMQDFWGAGFFHSIFLPLFALVLGSAGSLMGVFLAWLRNRGWSKTV